MIAGRLLTFIVMQLSPNHFLVGIDIAKLSVIVVHEKSCPEKQWKFSMEILKRELKNICLFK